jgi:hypothetical protein
MRSVPAKGPFVMYQSLTESSASSSSRTATSSLATVSGSGLNSRMYLTK